MLKILKVINNLITKIAQTALVFFLSGMVLLIFVQVIYRYIIKEPLSWSEELATYFFSGIIFFCAMTFYTYPLARDILALGGVSPSMEWLKLGWIFMIVPVGSMLSLLMMLEVLLKTFVEKEGA